MNARFSFITLSLILALLAYSVAPAYAQTAPTPGGVDLSVSADSPVPGQNVVITARSYSTNINASTVTWMVNGRVVSRGVGLTSLTITAPAMGKITTVDVTITTQDGMVFENSIGLSSGSVDLVVESEGYVPPFFPGKIPVAYQNTVKVIAVPHLANASGVEYDPKSLIYRWEQGTTVLENQSGYGKQAIMLTGGIIPRAHQVKVTVSTRDGSVSTSRIAAIALTSPSISFYKNDPLYGPLYNVAVNKNIYIGGTREMGIVAVPYGFNLPADGLGTLALTWLINNTVRPELSQNRTITLRAPAGTAGASNISLKIENTKDILQTAEGAFTALFTAGSTTPQAVF